MAFIDELNFYAEAGRGGDGVVRWRQEKFVPRGGPAGGDGGRGGDFYIEAVRDIGILAQYKAKKEFKADRGEDGGKKSLHGKTGADHVLKLPVGSIVTNTETGEKWELNNPEEKFMILRGGYGGYGNEHFKSSTNTTPKQQNNGEEGQKGNFHVELELFADMGLVGLPNAGKSSLLNSITNAQAKVGNYAFTTLDPNLGDFFGHIIADLPGLIEGASEGKGLGVKFLKHIKRTRMLAHLVSFENEDMMATYKEIRKELENFGQGLAEKEEIIVLTKTDTVDDKKIKSEVKKFEKLKNVKQVLTLSLYDDAQVETFKHELSKILGK